MPASFANVDPQRQLSAEDLLWPGGSLEVLNHDDLAHQMRMAGENIHLHRGVWWRQVNFLFCRTVFGFARIDSRQSWPSPLRAAGGFMHLALPNAPCNGVYPVIARDNVASYSIQQLGAGERSKIRRGLGRLNVRLIERSEDFQRDGYEVYSDWQRRSRWDSKAFQTRMCGALQHPKRTVIGAYQGEKLAAFLIAYALDGIAILANLASHSHFLKCFPNDVLVHTFLCFARQTRSVESVVFSGVSGRSSQNSFKLRYGSIRQFPSYTWINPLIRPMCNRWLGQWSPRGLPSRGLISSEIR